MGGREEEIWREESVDATPYHRTDRRTRKSEAVKGGRDERVFGISGKSPSFFFEFQFFGDISKDIAEL